MNDPTFVAAARTADVGFAGPPCRTYSSAGKQWGDLVPDGKLIYQHLEAGMRNLRLPVYIVETSPTLPAA